VGASNRRIIVHHILPNAILTETALSFRGFGVQPSTASWGNMLNAADSIEVIQSMPWIWIPPYLPSRSPCWPINSGGDALRVAANTHYTTSLIGTQRRSAAARCAASTTATAARPSSAVIAGWRRSRLARTNSRATLAKASIRRSE